MTDLLIHSMSEFASLIEPCLKQAKVRNIAEIGSEFGGMSRILADHCEAADGCLTCIDPAPKAEFTDWVTASDHLRHMESESLETIETLSDIDGWVIDGDHNYYTVSRELAAIDKVCARDGKPILAFLHDISWPWARRDLYYAPGRIPAEHRHPFSYDHGATLDSSEAVENRGYRGCGQFAVALQEGGPRNGVLTAVEDFLEEANTDQRPLYFVHVPGVFGLGVIFDASAPWAQEMGGFLVPFHENPLIATLEENRLRNYLAVIEAQDRAATQPYR